MKKLKIIERVSALLLFFIMLSLPFANAGDDVNGKKTNKPLAKVNEVNATGKNGDAYRLFINNINLPLNRKGIIAAVNIAHPDPNVSGAGGKFANQVFLFSSGFFLSGYKGTELWASACASASLVEDYIQGTVKDGQNDPRAVMYVLRADEPAFGKGWQDWTDAVALGADFWDADGNGIYEPVDKNGNGIWDKELEDAPDILGDETVWCVYHDGVPAPNRRWLVDPLGIEVRQTVFAFASAGPLGNIIFVRYRFKYVGLQTTDPDKLTDVYFSVWSDPDLGDHTDDFIGSDTLRDAGYVYNKLPDALYGTQCPSFLTDFFSGPVAYIKNVTYTDVNNNDKWDEGTDIALDTAQSSRGPIMGIKRFPGAMNLKLSSFMIYINGDAQLSDPNTKFEARNYMLAKTKTGADVDPCAFAYGEVVGGVACASVNNKYLFSGDPVRRIGWLNNTPADARQMQNIGPFELEKDIEKEVVVAYVVGQGANALASVDVAKAFSDGAQFIFDQNFAAPTPPPIINPTVLTGEDFIDIMWNTKETFAYKNKTTAYDLRFKGYKMHAYMTSTTEVTVNNVQNKFDFMHLAKDDFIYDVYKEDPSTGKPYLLYPRPDSLNRLDSAAYANETTGKIRIRVTKDPINNTELIKGKPYYFSLVSYGLNYDALYKDPESSNNKYILSAAAFVGEVENIPKIFAVIMGENLYNPPKDTMDVPKIAGFSKGKILYDVVDKNALTGEKYKVTFFKDSSSTTTYSTFWKLTNETKGVTLLDSMKNYYTQDNLFTNPNIGVNATDGFIVKVLNVTPKVGEMNITTANNVIDKTLAKFHYLSRDAEGATLIDNIGGVLNTLFGVYTTADKMRRVELRFDPNNPGKAYRYIQGIVGTVITRRNSVRYAENVTPASVRSMPVPRPVVGNWIVTGTDTVANGFVDVPFTAWIKDYVTGEEKQLAVGFIEKADGNPDGVWDPDTNAITVSGEYIIVFDQAYDPNGNINVYKGSKYLVATDKTNYADLRGTKAGYTLPTGHTLTPMELKIAESPFFNALYAVALPKKAGATGGFVAGDKVEITVDAYPYTSADEFTFSTTAGGVLSQDEEKNLFEKVNVYPNPLYGFNPMSSYSGTDPDETFITFSNLPEVVTVKIYTLAGTLVRTLDQSQKSSPTSPFLRWDLQNEDGLRVASGLYLAIVSSPTLGDKVLKFSIIMPQKQLQKY